MDWLGDLDVHTIIDRKHPETNHLDNPKIFLEGLEAMLLGKWHASTMDDQLESDTLNFQSVCLIFGPCER